MTTSMTSKHKVPLWRASLVVAILATSLLTSASAEGAGTTADPTGTRESNSYVSEALAKTRADTWHQAGLQGEGVRIAILGQFNDISWDEAAARFELPPRPIETYCGSPVCTVWVRPGQNAVAEAVHDIAPEAEIVLARTSTVADLQAAVDWFAENDIDVIVRTRLGPLDGPGDGTGPLNAVLEDAVDQGMIVVQPAGDAGGTVHHPGSYLRWTYADEDNDGIVEFAPGDERLSVGCGTFHGLRWGDFGEGAGTTDYNLYAFRGYQLHSSVRNQLTGAAPVEDFLVCSSGDRFELEVRRANPGTTAEGDVLELFGEGMRFERWTANGSAAAMGADSTSSGVLAVGAIDPALGTVAGGFSSRGPTTDDRLAPDITAASCYASTITEPNCFSGSRASAALVAGAAALYVGEHPEATPADVVTWMTTNAVVDRGVPGPDDIYGAGELRLPVRGPRPVYRPDARIFATNAGGVIGDNRYNADGAQQGATLSHQARRSVGFRVTLQNDGTLPERFHVDATYAFSATYSNWNVDYNVNGDYIDTEIRDGRWISPVIAPGGSLLVRVGVTIPDAPRNGRFSGVVKVLSYSNLRAVDVVRYTVTRRR